MSFFGNSQPRCSKCGRYTGEFHECEPDVPCITGQVKCATCGRFLSVCSKCGKKIVAGSDIVCDTMTGDHFCSSACYFS